VTPTPTPTPTSPAVPTGTFSVKDYGAHADGVTDDVQAILAAIAAAGGQDVYFPAGTYRLASTLTVPDGTHYVGPGWTSAWLKGRIDFGSNSSIGVMTGLEEDFPGVSFVYMTGHTDGSGLTGNLHVSNQQIRDYCKANDKILYDFEDIESYDPDGTYFGDRNVADSCDYDGGNWATEWQNSHTQGVDWYDCDSAHSQPLNANLKAYAAWWLWARLAGWDGGSTVIPTPTIVSFSPTSGRVGGTVTVTGTNLTGVTAVKFNGIAASFTVNSETEITATVPAAARSGKIAVTTPGGTALSPTGFKVEPLLSTLSPTAGRRGVIVTITGTGFCASRGTSHVRFGTMKCGTYVSWTSTRIRCRVPAKAVFGGLSVRVTTTGGTSNAKTFTVRR